MTLTRHITRPLTRNIIRSIVDFDPRGFSGNVLWLDAADNTTITKDGSNNGTAVSDKSLEGNDSTGTFTYDATGLNGKPTLTFNGSSNFLEVASLTLPTQFTLFVVSDTNNDLFIEHSVNAGSNDGFFFYGAGLSPCQLRRSPSQVAPANNADWIGTDPVIGELINDGSLLSYVKDGVQIGLVDSSGLANSDSTQTLYIGARAGASLFTTGNISEIIIYNRSLSTPERSAVTAYLGNKWDISV